MILDLKVLFSCPSMHVTLRAKEPASQIKRRPEYRHGASGRSNILQLGDTTVFLSYSMVIYTARKIQIVLLDAYLLWQFRACPLVLFRVSCAHVQRETSHRHRDMAAITMEGCPWATDHYIAYCKILVKFFYTDVKKIKSIPWQRTTVFSAYNLQLHITYVID